MVGMKVEEVAVRVYLKGVFKARKSNQKPKQTPSQKVLVRAKRWAIRYKWVFLQECVCMGRGSRVGPGLVFDGREGRALLNGVLGPRSHEPVCRRRASGMSRGVHIQHDG